MNKWCIYIVNPQNFPTRTTLADFRVVEDEHGKIKDNLFHTVIGREATQEDALRVARETYEALEKQYL